jgi:hypothetical protein
MARRLASLVCLLLALSGLSLAEESYLGMFIQDQKIGYVASTTTPESVGGLELSRSDTRTVLDAGLLGQSLKVSIFAQSWTDSRGKPQLMKFAVESGGRSQKTEANFAANKIHLVIDNNGAVSRKTLEIPAGANVVDDAMTRLLDDGVPVGTERVYYVLDPMTAALIKNTAKLVGPAKVNVRGKEYDATLIEIAEPRATMRVFVSAKGDLIKAEAFAGIAMMPISKEEALSDEGPARPLDLANLTKITVDKPLGELDTILSSRLEVSDVNLSRAPTDGHQTVKRSGQYWIVDLHPLRANPKSAASIAAAGKQKPQWLKPGLNIPSDSASFKSLAKEVVGKSKTTPEGAGKIGKYVYAKMRPNAGIGVLRDASEVLKSREGVCRDYAILTATLLRAAGIPARLCSGLVFANGAFYYHAWVEYWDGKQFVGLDSTRPTGKVTGGHIKLAHGSVEEAFLFTFLDKARIKVLNVSRTAK